MPCMINRQGSYAKVGDSNPSAATVKRLDILRSFLFIKEKSMCFGILKRGNDTFYYLSIKRVIGLGM